MDQTIDNDGKTSVEDKTVDSHTETDANYEAQAREMGWTPKEQFRGDQSKWLDAKSYYERGETVLPIVKAKLRQTEAKLEEVTKVAQEWVELNKADTARREVEWKAKYEEALQSKKDAVAQGDGEKFAEAEATQRDLEAKKPQPPKQEVKLDPEFKSWLDENPWYNTDKAKTLQANLLGAHLAAGGLRGRKLYDAVNERLAEFDEMAQGKARGGAQRGGKPANESRGAKSYENLKPEFREQCDRQFKYFGGKGTVEAWRKSWISKADDDFFRS